MQASPAQAGSFVISQIRGASGLVPRLDGGQPWVATHTREATSRRMPPLWETPRGLRDSSAEGRCTSVKSVRPFVRSFHHSVLLHRDLGNESSYLSWTKCASPRPQVCSITQMGSSIPSRKFRTRSLSARETQTDPHRRHGEFVRIPPEFRTKDACQAPSSLCRVPPSAYPCSHDAPTPNLPSFPHPQPGTWDRRSTFH